MIQSLTTGQGLKCTHDLKWLSSKWLLEEKKAKRKGEAPFGNKQVKRKRSKMGKVSILRTRKNKAKFRRQDFPGGPVVKNLPTNIINTGSILGPGRFHMPQRS